MFSSKKLQFVNERRCRKVTKDVCDDDDASDVDSDANASNESVAVAKQDPEDAREGRSIDAGLPVGDRKDKKELPDKRVADTKVILFYPVNSKVVSLWMLK